MAEAPDSNRTRQLDLESSDLPMQRSPDIWPFATLAALTSVEAQPVGGDGLLRAGRHSGISRVGALYGSGVPCVRWRFSPPQNPHHTPARGVRQGLGTENKCQQAIASLA